MPGIPLAIARPDAKVLLIESTQKKAAFLTEAAQKLELTNVQVTSERAEAIGHSPRRERFDVVIARALAEMTTLVEWCLPLVAKGGKLLAMKGPKVAEELPRAANAIRLVNGGEAVVHRVELVGTSGHVIVEIGKLGRTDPRYPRSVATMKKRPL